MSISHRPTHDYIIGIKRPAPAMPTMPLIAGLHRPVAKPPHHYADIVAVGPGRPNVQTGYTPPPPCRAGDCVMVREVAGDPETIDGVEYHWFIPDEILAVVDNASSVALVS